VTALAVDTWRWCTSPLGKLKAPESHYNQAPVREPPSTLPASHAKGGTRACSIRLRFSPRFKRKRGGPQSIGRSYHIPTGYNGYTGYKV
jgi:hypothetical protein